MKILTLAPLLWTTLLGIASLPVYAQGSVSVDVYYPESANANQVLQLTGSIEAEQHAELASLEAGVVAQLFVEVGDSVNRGDKLMELDATLAELTLSETQAALKAAQVARDEAERLYNEVLALSKQQVVAQTLIAERRALLAAAEADLIQQQASQALQQEIVDRHTLYAPFTGIVALRNADLGEWVTQQTSVFTLIEQGTLRLTVEIPQEYYAMLSGHNAVEVLVQPDFVDAQRFSARLDRLVAVSDSQSRTLTGHIYLPEGSNLVSGMSARAEIMLPDQNQAMVWLPRSALKLHPDGGSSVFAVVNNRAKRVLVEVIEQRNDQIAVTNASAEQGYVISGVELLRDGVELQVNTTQGRLQ